MYLRAISHFLVIHPVLFISVLSVWSAVRARQSAYRLQGRQQQPSEQEGSARGVLLQRCV